MKIKITMTVDLGESFGELTDKSEREWFESIMTEENTYIHNNDIGDELGKVVQMNWKFLTD